MAWNIICLCPFITMVGAYSASSLFACTMEYQVTQGSVDAGQPRTHTDVWSPSLVLSWLAGPRKSQSDMLLFTNCMLNDCLVRACVNLVDGS